MEPVHFYFAFHFEPFLETRPFLPFLIHLHSYRELIVVSLSLSLSLSCFFFVVLFPCWKFPFQFFKLAPALRAVITTRFRHGMGNENSREGEQKKKKNGIAGPRIGNWANTGDPMALQ